jgi:hypothetical protein
MHRDRSATTPENMTEPKIDPLLPEPDACIEQGLSEPTAEEKKARRSKQWVDKLTTWLGESHAQWFIMIIDLRSTQLSDRQRAIVNQAHRKLIRYQNAFLSEFGNWTNPEQN